MLALLPRVVLHIRSPWLTLAVLKPSTGEPCAGEPPARFGGRGELILFPTPIIPPALLVVADS